MGRPGHDDLGDPVLALSLWAGAASAADEIKLSNNQRIACGRGLNAGKLQNINCKSYAYIFNTRTSEFYRCQVSVGVTRDNKEVLKVDTDGACMLKARIFPSDSSYAFDATETEPPNTNTALSEKEAFVVGAAVFAARHACEPGTTSMPAGQVRARVNDLIRLARRKPDDIGTAFGEAKNTPRNGLKQVVAALEEDDCAPAVAQTAREALASL